MPFVENNTVSWFLVGEHLRHCHCDFFFVLFVEACHVIFKLGEISSDLLLTSHIIPFGEGAPSVSSAEVHGLSGACDLMSFNSFENSWPSFFKDCFCLILSSSGIPFSSCPMCLLLVSARLPGVLPGIGTV